MFVIIVGCSATGYHLSKRLMVERHEVVVLEKSLARCQLLWDEMGSVVMQGDGADLVDLRRAGITRADTLVAVTNKDETNLVICQLAKQAFSVERTVATIKDPGNESIFRVLGVDTVVNLGDLALGTLERTIVGNSYNHLANLREPGSFLVSLTIPEDAAMVGQPLSEMGQFDRSFITVVLRNHQAIRPSDELELKADDEVYAVTVSDEEAELYEKLTGV